MADAHNNWLRDMALYSAELLIVDDEAMDLEQSREIMTKAGYHAIRSACDPCEALALSHTLAPDLILLDRGMPKMDGIAVLERLRAEWQGGFQFAPQVAEEFLHLPTTEVPI
jgi:CheY-like chemotaxis protein